MTAEAMAVAAALAAMAASGAAGDRSRELGESVQGRNLRAVQAGYAVGAPRVLVVGSIHGDEREGHEVVRRLRRTHPATAPPLWTVRSLNPDGAAARTRTNARGVDLNRSFPYRWRADQPPGSRYYPGPEPGSEPEARVAMRLIRRLRPEVTIWFHQPWGRVLAPCTGDAGAERLYARVARMRVARCRGQRLRGTATSWQERRVGGTAFVVELGGAELRAAEVRRHTRAVARVAARFGDARPRRP